MRGVTAIAAQIVLWLFMWTSAVALIATAEMIADPQRRESWVRALGLVTLALSVLIVLWAIA